MTSTSSAPVPVGPVRGSAEPVVGATGPVRPGVLDRAVRAGVTALGALPDAVLRRLAGTPTVVDGQRLEPEVQLALSVLHRLPGKTFEELGLAEGRRQIDVEAWQFGGRPAPVGRIQDMLIPGADGPIPARLYHPVGATPETVDSATSESRSTSSPEALRSPDSAAPPLVLYFHGGGFVLGSIASHEPIARFLAHHAQAAVLLVGYRLAPEHPFPAAHEDAIAAYAWAASHTEDLGVANRIAVAGDSAGGNLALAVSIAARDRGLPAPSMQVLLSPWLDLASARPSHDLFDTFYFLTVPQLDWYRDHLLPGLVTGTDPTPASDDAGPLATDPRVSPLREPDLAGLPPTYLAYAGFDVLRDESRELADRLREAGVPITERCHTGHIHPFSNVLGVGRTGRAAALEIARAVREGLQR